MDRHTRTRTRMHARTHTHTHTHTHEDCKRPIGMFTGFWNKQEANLIKYQSLFELHTSSPLATLTVKPS